MTFSNLSDFLHERNFKIETMRGHGNGGQNRNKRETAIRITHIPTGISEFCQDERSQSQNKAVAMARLVAVLTSIFEGARRRRLRERYPPNTETVYTYNFIRNTVKDHRTGQVRDLRLVMEGKL